MPTSIPRQPEPPDPAIPSSRSKPLSSGSADLPDDTDWSFLWDWLDSLPEPTPPPRVESFRVRVGDDVLPDPAAGPAR
jgi:hypothetical protein